MVPVFSSLQLLAFSFAIDFVNVLFHVQIHPTVRIRILEFATCMRAIGKNNYSQTRANSRQQDLECKVQMREKYRKIHTFGPSDSDLDLDPRREERWDLSRDLELRGKKPW